MLYVDSAVLVSLHCEERTTAGVRRWITRQRGPWRVSEWVLTECVSAFGLKVRCGELSADAANLAIDAIEHLISESFEIIPITSSHHRRARAWLRAFERGLRAADALHLAVAHESGCRLATCDAILVAGAKALRVRIVKATA